MQASRISVKEKRRAQASGGQKVSVGNLGTP